MAMADSPRMRFRTLSFAAVALALAGCSPDSADKDADAKAAATRAPPAEAVHETLAAGDVEGGALTGELACSFTERGAEAPMLIAMADVANDARAEGVLKLGPSVLRVSADKLGGFNAMVNGARFLSGDLEARVVVISGAPLDASESPPLPARLEIATDAGAQRIDGEWTCGP